MGMFLPIFVCLRFHIKCIAMASTTSKKSSRSSSDSSKALSLLATTTSIWAVVFKHTVITWGSLWRKKTNFTSAIPGVPSVPAAKNYYLAGKLLCLYLHCTCRIMKQTEGCDETKMISLPLNQKWFRGRGREREGKIHLNAAMVCLLNPYSGWMRLTAPQLTSTCINHRLNWISANLPSRWLLTSSNSGRTNT